MTIKHTFIIALLTLAGAVIAILLNALVIDTLIVPDPCAYHGKETGILFYLFYDLTASEGYHPTPSLFNIIFTLVVGGYIGYTVSKRITKQTFVE